MQLDLLSQPLEKLSANPSDAHAWEALYQALWPYLIGVFFRQFRGQRRLAEEGAQDVMLRLLRYANFNAGCQEPRAFLSYVHSACRSVAADWYRREGSEPSGDATFELDLLESQDALNPEEEQITRDLIDKVSSRLSGEEVLLSEALLKGQTPEEICAGLHIDISAYYQRVSRLKKRLRSIVGALSETAH